MNNNPSQYTNPEEADPTTEYLDHSEDVLQYGPQTRKQCEDLFNTLSENKPST